MGRQPGADERRLHRVATRTSRLHGRLVAWSGPGTVSVWNWQHIRRRGTVVSRLTALGGYGRAMAVFFESGLGVP